jgi:hypothetical protein
MMDWKSDPKIAGDILLQLSAQQSRSACRMAASKLAVDNISSNSLPLT